MRYDVVVDENAGSEVSGIPASMYDPESVGVSASGPQRLTATERREASDLMAALVALRDAEDRLSDASRAYMRLNKTDMRTLHYLIAAQTDGSVVTPGAISAFLGITTASTTKLLDRLERGGHIVRARHPEDRRALAVSVTKQTREAAVRSVGRQQAKRLNAVARLSSDERGTVTRFLRDMAREIDVSEADWATGPEESG